MRLQRNITRRLLDVDQGEQWKDGAVAGLIVSGNRFVATAVSGTQIFAWMTYTQSNAQEFLIPPGGLVLRRVWQSVLNNNWAAFAGGRQVLYELQSSPDSVTWTTVYTRTFTGTDASWRPGFWNDLGLTLAAGERIRHRLVYTGPGTPGQTIWCVLALESETP